MELIISLGIPTAVTGLLAWFFKRMIDKRDTEKEKKEAEERRIRDEREKNTEALMLKIMQNSKATYILASATAKAVQRIPDAHCNGDMTSALEQAENVQKDEQQFLMDHGIRHIFEK